MEDFNKNAYSTWKRRNITYRGMINEPYENPENGGGAMLGRGLYTTKDKSMARKYGTLWYVLGGIPSKPLKVDTLNAWEVWTYRNLYEPVADENDQVGIKNFNKLGLTFEGEIMKLGYDGIIIKGREMVHFNPSDVRYFRNERDAQEYFYYNVGNTV